jgi:GH25 family lysozyme M1 (1,4-beta-N-acetylmuramidase)
MSLSLIDVSKHQGTIDMTKVKESGINGVIVRAGYGNDISQEDPNFDVNVKNALSAGLYVGAYWFSYAISADDAAAEASVFKQILKPYIGKMLLPVAFDYEEDSMAYSNKKGIPPTVALINSIEKSFASEMKKDGWCVVTYSDCSMYSKYHATTDTMSYFDGLWLADYSGGPNYPCVIQQTSSTGSVSGISGNVDMDTCSKDYPTFIRTNGLNGFEKPKSFSIDTAAVSIYKGNSYQFKITSTSTPVITVANGNSFAGTLVSQDGTSYYYKVIAVGNINDCVGLYVNGTRASIMTIVDPSLYTSDTTGSVKIKKGNTYQFKITADVAIPSFGCGSSEIQIVSTIKDGDDYFVKVKALGNYGDNVGFYVNGIRTAIIVIS